MDRREKKGITKNITFTQNRAIKSNLYQCNNAFFLARACCHQNTPLIRVLSLEVIPMAEKGSEGSKSDKKSSGSKEPSVDKVSVGGKSDLSKAKDAPKDEKSKEAPKDCQLKEVPKDEKSKEAPKGIVPENKCSICMELLEPQQTMVTSCNHKFHRECILIWLNDKNTTCPMDRTNLAVHAMGDELDTNENTLAQRLNLTCSSIDSPDPKNGPYFREIVFSTPTIAIEGPGLGLGQPTGQSRPSGARSAASRSRPNSSVPASGQSSNVGRRSTGRRQELDPVGQALMGITSDRGGRRSPSPNRGPSRSQGIDPSGLHLSTGRGPGLRPGLRGEQGLSIPIPPMDPEPHKMVLWFNNLRPQVELKNMSDQYNVVVLKGNKILGVVPKRSKARLLVFLIVGPPGKSMIRGEHYPEIDTLTFHSNGIEKRLENDDEYKRFIGNKSSKRSVAFVERRVPMNRFIQGLSHATVKNSVQLVPNGKSVGGNSSGSRKE